jgi:hypothetical protein
MLRRKAQSIVEVIAAVLIIIPIALFLLDVGALVLAQTANDTLAKNAARAAAEQPDETKAKAAVKEVVDKFPLSPIVPEKPVVELQYNLGNDVNITTTVNVKLLVPIPLVPGMQNPTFKAQAHETIVAALAN